MTTNPHPHRRRAFALTVGALLTLGVANPASASSPKPPSFLLDSDGHWRIHDTGWYPVVQGPALVLDGRRTLEATLSATIQPDDKTMPAPGECESGIAFVFVVGSRRAETTLSSAGRICGHYLQPPTSVVTHSFTGTAIIEESGQRRLEGQEAFLDIRLADDGRAGVFATT